MAKLHRGAIRLSAVVAAALLIAGCATGARTGAMTVPMSADTLIADTSPAFKAIGIGKVSGGSDTNPLWKSNVSDANFRDALDQSLQVHAMAATENARYLLNAELVELDRPFAGFDMTVTAKVHYTLVPQAGGAPRLDQIVETPYTAQFGDALIGVERLRLANEGAIRENITVIVKKLIETLEAAPKPSS